jgi:xanthine dehydrogenase iron-sulfur cluster and FAD-binding subunit A
MRKLIVAATAAIIASAALAAPVKADETTVIRKDDGMGDHKTIIKKHEDRTFIAPREEKKVIIDHD